VLPFDVRRLKQTLARWQVGLSDVGWNSLYWDNHDQPRVVSRFGDDGRHRERCAKTLATVLHLQRGTPYVYQGDELGMTNYPFESIEDFRDIESVNYYKESVRLGEDPEEVLASLRAMGRDNSRTPMQWDASPHAGFTKGEPWIPVHPDHTEVNAERQVGEPGSVFEHYRRLIAFRHEEPAVVHGDFTLLLPEDEHLFAYTRSHEGTELLVLGNFSGSEVDVPGAVLDPWAGAELLLGNVPGGSGARLGPWESRVYRRRV
jgi:oligo-1,6-glucosidase